MIFMRHFNYIDRQNVIQKQNNPQQKTFTWIVQYSNKTIIIHH